MTRTRTYRKDVTSEELSRMMPERIARLTAGVVVDREAADRFFDDRELRARRPEKPTHKKRSEPRSALPREQSDFLKSVVSRPLLSTTQRASELGLSADAANRLKKELIGNSLVEVVKVNRGQSFGGLVHYLALTEAGCKAIRHRAKRFRPQNCSAEHYWWQQQIHAALLEQGKQAEIEHSLSGKRADVAEIEGNDVVAWEVGLSAPENEVSNAVRNLAAGFHRVVLCTKNRRMQTAVGERLLAALNAEESGRVTLTTLPELAFVNEYLDRMSGRSADRV